jgi:hypothetical protein
MPLFNQIKRKKIKITFKHKVRSPYLIISCLPTLAHLEDFKAFQPAMTARYNNGLPFLCGCTCRFP